MKLFEPGKIGRLAVKNRIVMAAMANGLVEPDGRLSQRGIHYYVVRAKGGAGMIITCTARPRWMDFLPFTPLGDRLVVDAKIYSGWLSELAEGLHDYGAKLALQVTPGGGRTVSEEILKWAGALAPSRLSAVANPNLFTREMSVEEIERLTQSFQFVAEIARRAGVDAIEINAHGGYLIDQFMTTLWNKRADEYGGNLDNRLRFLVEIIGYLKKGAGADFPVMVKFPLTHYLPGGRGVEEGLEIARKLEAAGADALDIDAGCVDVSYWEFPPGTQPPGCMVDLAEKVKGVVKIPVIAVGRLHFPELAEKVLLEGKADFIAIGRGLLADPEWPNKVKRGMTEEICPCIGDTDCYRRTREGKSISCTVNPATGMEKELAVTPAERRKSVLVVGGGPGGMESAIVAALRGHKVTLCEKGNALGGNLIPASVPDFKSDYKDLIDYLSSQVKKLGAEIKLGTEVTPEFVQSVKPEAVFIATGSTPILPQIPGIDKENVVTAVDLLLGKKKAGASVVVAGGGAIGCETALHLAKEGRKVTVVEMLDSIAHDVWWINRLHLLKLLGDNNVRMLTGTKLSEITVEGVIIANKKNEQSSLPADTVVLAVGMKPDRKLLDALEDKVPELYAIGDCVEPRKVVNAMREGFRLARLV